MEPCARPVVTGWCILHGRVRVSRFPWRVRAAFMTVPDGSRVQCGDWRCQPRLPVRFRAGILRASLMRPQSAGFPNGSKTRIRRTGCGVEQFPCRRRARQHPISCAGWGSSPTQQWAEFPESPRAALAPVRRGDGRRCIPRIRGADPGLRRRPTVIPSNHAARHRVIPGASPSDTGAGRVRSVCPSHLRGGRASPSHHDRQPWCDAGPGAPGSPQETHPDGWWHTPVRGRPADGPLV